MERSEGEEGRVTDAGGRRESKRKRDEGKRRDKERLKGELNEN